jgi:hypothetical protein
MSVVAGDYAFAFGLATGCKPAALTGSAFRIFCAAQGLQTTTAHAVFNSDDEAVIAPA